MLFKDEHTTWGEEMNAYLEKGIKEVIIEFPEIEAILKEYDIGCGPCTVGTCLLKDIVAIHNLPKDQEKELMARIANTMDPNQETQAPKVRKSTGATPREIKYSPPIKKLVDEHVLIKRLIALIPKIVNNLDVENIDSRQLVLDGIEMIRSYADRFHHAKEEDILFKYFDENLDIIKVMFEDHIQGRGYVKAVLDALDRREVAIVYENMMAYRELLTEHIKKEDEILYPWMDKQLSTTQVGELHKQFEDAEKELGISPEKYEKFITKLEEKFKTKEFTMNDKTETLDLRDMPPAQRHQKIFEIWNRLSAGETLKIINDHDPKPLQYQFAAEYEGMFEWEYEQDGPLDWIVNIKRIS